MQITLNGRLACRRKVVNIDISKDGLGDVQTREFSSSLTIKQGGYSGISTTVLEVAQWTSIRRKLQGTDRISRHVQLHCR
jgi:hypothetical protein